MALNLATVWTSSMDRHDRQSTEHPPSLCGLSTPEQPGNSSTSARITSPRQRLPRSRGHASPQTASHASSGPRTSRTFCTTASACRPPRGYCCYWTYHCNDDASSRKVFVSMASGPADRPGGTLSCLPHRSIQRSRGDDRLAGVSLCEGAAGIGSPRTPSSRRCGYIGRTCRWT